MPATDTDFEREFAELVAQLRSVQPSAPETVRARVRALGEPDAPLTLRDRLAWIRPRRALLLALPAGLGILLSIAVVRGALSSGDTQGRQALTAVAHGSQRGTEVHGAVTTTATGSLDASGTNGRDTFAPSALPAPAPGGRPVDYDASLRVRVRDADALSDRSAEAMRIARGLGGYVASVEQSTTAGRPGEADLVLRIPVGHVEDALIRLAGLGTVIEQHVSIVDLQQTLDQQRRRIRSLRVQIARLTEALHDPSLAADVRLRLQLQLADARSALARTTGSNKATLREAALSEVSLSLTTQRAGGVATKHGDGRIERAARNALSFLAAAGAIVLFLAIALSPLLLAAAAWLYGTRAYRRREERRLLAATPE